MITFKEDEYNKICPHQSNTLLKFRKVIIIAFFQIFQRAKTINRFKLKLLPLIIKGGHAI